MERFIDWHFHLCLVLPKGSKLSHSNRWRKGRYTRAHNNTIHMAANGNGCCSTRWYRQCLFHPRFQVCLILTNLCYLMWNVGLQEWMNARRCMFTEMRMLRFMKKGEGRLRGHVMNGCLHVGKKTFNIT